MDVGSICAELDIPSTDMFPNISLFRNDDLGFVLLQTLSSAFQVLLFLYALSPMRHELYATTLLYMVLGKVRFYEALEYRNSHP